jgi:WD40 repeat protein
MPDTNRTLIVKSAKSLWFNDTDNEVGALLFNDDQNIHVFDFETGREIRAEKFSQNKWNPGAMETSDAAKPPRLFEERENYTIECKFGDTESYSCIQGGENCSFDLGGRNSCSSSGLQPGIDYASLPGTAISRDGKYRLTSSNDGGVVLWNQLTGNQIKMLAKVDSGKGALGAAFSADSTLAAYVGAKPVYSDGAWLMVGDLVIYDVVEARDVQKIKLDLYQGNVSMLAFSPDAKLISVGTFDGKVAIYEVSSARLVYEFFAHNGMVADLEFSPDGKLLLTAGGMDETVKLWAVVDGG